jgi:hypothetical protein
MKRRVSSSRSATQIPCPACGKRIPIPDLIEAAVQSGVAEQKAAISKQELALRQEMVKIRKAGDTRVHELELELSKAQSSARKVVASQVKKALSQAEEKAALTMETLKARQERELRKYQACIVSLKADAKEQFEEGQVAGRKQLEKLQVDLMKTKAQQASAQQDLAKTRIEMERLEFEREAVFDQGRMEALKEASKQVQEIRKLMANLQKQHREQDDEWQTRLEKELLAARQQEAMRLEKLLELRVDEERRRIRLEVEDAHSVEVRQTEIKLHQMRDQLDQMRRKVELGNSEQKGRAAEDVLFDDLTQAFGPEDDIVRAKKGQKAGDFLISIRRAGGLSILLESKFHQTWQNEWIEKALDDGKRMGAAIIVISTRTQPTGLDGITQERGVWIVPRPLAIPVSLVLREGLIQIQQARHQNRMDDRQISLLLEYLTSSALVRRVEQVVANINKLKDRLAQERTQHEHAWGIAQAAHQMILHQTIGLYSDLNNAAGTNLGQSKLLEKYLVPDPHEKSKTKGSL